MRDSTTFEKIALLGLAAASVVTLALIAVMALRAGMVDPNASALIGVIVTGLIAFGKDIIQAIRGYSMSAQLSKVTDQLAASGPVAEPAVPADAAQAAQATAGAAQDKADQIADKAEGASDA